MISITINLWCHLLYFWDGKIRPRASKMLGKLCTTELHPEWKLIKSTHFPNSSLSLPLLSALGPWRSNSLCWNPQLKVPKGKARVNDTPISCCLCKDWMWLCTGNVVMSNSLSILFPLSHLSAFVCITSSLAYSNSSLLSKLLICQAQLKPILYLLFSCVSPWSSSPDAGTHAGLLQHLFHCVDVSTTAWGQGLWYFIW